MAIARDTFSNFSIATGAGTTATKSFTVTGTDTWLVTEFQQDPAGAGVVTGVTWNGDAMTQLRATTIGTGTNAWYVYGILAADTGTNNMVITGSANGKTYTGTMASYTGVKQTSNPEATQTASGTGDSVSTSVTPLSANSWVVMPAANRASDWTAGTGSNAFVNVSGTGIFDSNGTVPVSAYLMELSRTGSSSSPWAAFQMAMAPVADPGPANLKSFDGNLKANIKSINGNLLANIKSLSGNA